MLESKFYEKKVRPYLLKMGFNRIYRIETGDTAMGIPDVYAVQEGCGAFWVEMKSIRRECKKVVSPKWEPGQVAFGKLCNKSGIRWALMILIGDRFFYTGVAKEKYTIDELEEIK